MKTVVLIMFIAVLATIWFWYVTENNRADKELAHIRQQEQLAKAEEIANARRAEDERIRQERVKEMAKEDATRLFLRFLDREEAYFKQIVEESKIELEKITLDQDSLSQELTALEAAEIAKSAAAKKRNVKRRDCVERIEAMLASPVLNRLASTYCGEDLSATLSKFRNHIGGLTKEFDEKNRRYSENRRKFYKSIKEVDRRVEVLSDKAGRQLREARLRLTGNVDNLRRRVERYRVIINKLEEKARVTTLNMKEANELKETRKALDVAEAQLISAEATSRLGSANSTHLELTQAETVARRASDIALAVRQDEDNAVEAEANQEMIIYNAVMLYEKSSLDNIRGAIAAAYHRIFERQQNASRKLKQMKDAATNIDFLDANEIEELRQKIAKSINDDILEGIEK